MIEFLDTSSNKWNRYINKLSPQFRDIYFTSEYYKLYEANGNSFGKLFIYKDKDNLAIYPFLINTINGYELDNSYYDIETAYGYGGPIVNTSDINFVRKFERIFKEYCFQNNIIAEFIRFHPFLNNHNLFRDNIKVVHNRTTTYINLDKSIEEIWKNDITSKNRNVIRKAQKLGLTVNFDSNLEQFKNVYKITMDKVKASPKYYFSEEYFNNLTKLDNVCISVNLGDLTIASSIFLKGYTNFHYHLSGSLKEYLKYSPNNFLLWTAIKYAKNNKFHKFHFGGGLTDNINDNLYKFKKSFCKNTADFYIGKRVHNKEVYDYLINKWENINGKKAELFLQYKM
ncbi:lipid II:glycine glycyltransferase FemX [Clostridium weizhouense]|uniref:GNAT family N-acetyltransferase n=1 Tax=Clostridium weizhouense TaxID=2859781 RepID=A0ABS7APN6_9CLOT|nr:GNAT family N-acetyltransferase [Clostridium weizhouense]MBW6409470.1 GNAT family N-acetyltransferase [Clostridium weizhouense]